MKEIDQGYMIMATRRSKQNASEEKSKMPKALSTKLCHIQGNNKIKFCEKLVSRPISVPERHF